MDRRRGQADRGLGIDLRAEKVNAIIGLARDDEVAAAVTAQLLTRPQVTAAALADEQTRHAVIHDLGRDAEVAAEVTATLLRQPQVAAKAMDDTAARRAVNTAQSDRGTRPGPRAPGLGRRVPAETPALVQWWSLMGR